VCDNRAFFSQFTTRQHEVLVCVLAGDTNTEIAERLEVSVSTVKRSVHQLLQAAGASRRSEIRRRWGKAAFAYQTP
jgi:DNA-binding NarL/FixJ family response regulator